ncbi:AAA family ATPase [Methylophaga sp.]|uniref:AAA family ATPase n=1 Tax=Methylophaga sp. TaxID=2024840 RepID=UPI0025FB2A48|nr:AAA family ATPase [Methylophaga sp.]
MNKKSLKDVLKTQTAVRDDFAYFSDQTEKLKSHLPEADKQVFELFNHSEVKELLDFTQSDKQKAVLRAMLKEPSVKRVAIINDDVLQTLDGLEDQFPNFSEVISLCKTSLLLSSLEQPGIIQLPPMLLAGPPGLGKTLFMHTLASKLGTDFYSLDMSTASSGFVINGGNCSWADSKPGFISDSLRKSRFANPVIMLDEVDKVTGSSQFDPLAPFYSLLEAHTARRFVDEYIEVPMNASAVMWVATANEPELIPAPILSRMHIVDIPQPTRSQARKIAQSVYTGLLKANPWGKHFAPYLNEHALEKLATLPPRQMKHCLKVAMGQSVQRSGGKYRPIIITHKDIRPDIRDSSEQRGMGFLAKI